MAFGDIDHIISLTPAVDIVYSNENTGSQEGNDLDLAHSQMIFLFQLIVLFIFLLCLILIIYFPFTFPKSVEKIIRMK